MTKLVLSKPKHNCDTLRSQQTGEPCPACTDGGAWDASVKAELNEQKLQERDERVATKVQRYINDHLSRAAGLKQEAEALERNANVIRRAVYDEEWWKLKGLVSEADIESLSNCSPTDLLSDYVTIDGERWDTC